MRKKILDLKKIDFWRWVGFFLAVTGAYILGNAEILSNQLILKGIKDPWLSKVLAISLTKQKKFSKAKKYFQEVIEMLPEDHDSYYNFAKSFLEQGDNDNALKYYKKAHAKNGLVAQSIKNDITFTVCTNYKKQSTKN